MADMHRVRVRAIDVEPDPRMQLEIEQARPYAGRPELEIVRRLPGLFRGELDGCGGRILPAADDAVAGVNEGVGGEGGVPTDTADATDSADAPNPTYAPYAPDSAYASDAAYSADTT
jgi:hypothetical protein